MGLFEFRKSGWKITLTLSDGELNSLTRRIWFRTGSLASSTMLCVTIGGYRLRLSANIRRFSNTWSSADKRVSAWSSNLPSLEFRIMNPSWIGRR
jgi:hypothetical protein